MLMTWAEKIETKSYARGRREELEEALNEMRDLVLRLVKRRFRAVPQEVARRVAEISSYRKLARLAEQVQEIDALEELDLN